MIGELLKAFTLIFLAEMGDKTQIIAMTFATKYKIKDVIKGIIIGVFLNHGIAILLGRFISKTIPLNNIQIIAGIMFVIFGIMALRDEKIDETEDEKNFGPIISVALAFFIGELGDKTQLTAMTLSSESNYPLFVLLGTTLGMVATSGLGIFVGSRIGEKIPEISIKIISSMIFITFGSIRLLHTLPKYYINNLNIALFLIIVLTIEFTLIHKLVSRRKTEKVSQMKTIAGKLYNQTRLLNKTLEGICLGEGKCGKCIGANCLIGYTRFILKEARENENYYQKATVDISSLIKKEYDINKVIHALSMIIVESIDYGWDSNKNFVINKIKLALETIIFGESLSTNKDLKDYLIEAKSKNKKYGLLLEMEILKALR